MPRTGEDSFETVVPGVEPGQRYGLRAEGPWQPEAGHLFNPAKLLVDPAARAVSGSLIPHPSLAVHQAESEDFRPNTADSAPWVPRSVVVDPAFDWSGDRPPETPWADTVIYELHVKGLTQLHPEVPPAHRGTYLGLAHPAVIEHLLALGVTAVELLPIQQSLTRPEITERGLSNYWGYDPISWFAPHGSYATADGGEQVTEFKTMVKALHRSGIEMLLDVVYNHSVEGDERELSLGLRGLDNASYYRHRPGQAHLQWDFTGCGNTLSPLEGPGLELMRQSLRFWVEEMHVDGFRFDLAPASVRGESGTFEPASGFLEMLEADPVLARVKRIAEPWDLGEGGFRLGRFPDRWAEWNSHFRDDTRSFWLHPGSDAREMAGRFEGSSELFGDRALGLSAGVNFVACHDGFTLADLLAYAERHNLANGEEGRDGHHGEISSNLGVEGPTEDLVIRGRRARLARSLLATLALARGTPMLSHGDELGRTQGGNNNAYCQDNETSWVDWEPDPERESLLAFARRAFELRRRLGLSRDAASLEPIRWLDPSGKPPSHEGWQANPHQLIAEVPSTAGPPVLMLVNRDVNPRTFQLPAPAAGQSWTATLDSGSALEGTVTADTVQMLGESVALLEQRPVAPAR